MLNRLRQIVTAVLLLFVGISFAWIFAGERVAVTASPSSQPSARFTVFYFYGNKRCDTCRKMESYSEEAVKAGFTDELANGTLEWRVVNREEPENAHYVEEYQLTTQAIILADHQSGEWVDLFEIWTRVDNKPDFLRYVQENLSEFIDKDEQAGGSNV